MKWIEKLIGKKEESLPEIKFEELEAWLDSKSRELSGPGQPEALFSKINDALRRVEKSATLLEEAIPEGRYHLKMVKIATSNRDNMVKQVRTLVENIRTQERSDARAMTEFHQNAMQSLNVCRENMLRSYQYTKLVFLEESKQVLSDVNSLGRLFNELIEPVEKQKQRFDALENAEKAIQVMKKSYFDIETEKRAIKENDEKAARLKKEIDETSQNNELIRSCEQWKQYQNYMDELARLENTAAQVESEITALISPLGKALNRLRQLSDSGRYTLAPDMKEGLRLCVSDPRSVDPEFFAEFEKIVKSDTLSLAQDKRNKILEQLRIIESSFQPARTGYRSLVQDIEKKKSEISNISIAKEQENLCNRIEVLKDRLAEAEKALEISKKHLVYLEQNVELKKNDLIQSVSAVDSSIRIDFSI